MAEPSAPFLATILTGPNAGAVLALSRGRHVIGGGEADDLVLDGLAPAALVISLRDNALRIETAPDAATDVNGLALETGPRAQVGLPVSLRLNDETMINLSRSVPLAAPRRSPWLLVLVGAAAFGFGMIGSASIRISVPMVDAMPAATPAPLAAPTAAPRPAGCDAACAETAATALREAMEAAGLGAMQVRAEGGVLRVSGNPGPNGQAAWASLRHAFETRHGQSLPLLVTLTEGPGEAADPGVVSVWLGETPELRTHTGEVLRPGDLTRDGWTVETIAPGLVTLTRGKRVTQIRF